jgi:uncharacterized protein
MENTNEKKSTQGFASMDPERHRAIASKGGKTVSHSREHMAAIGKKGGSNTAKKGREHMSAIGQKGGKNSAAKRAKKG